MKRKSETELTFIAVYTARLAKDVYTASHKNDTSQTVKNDKKQSLETG